MKNMFTILALNALALTCVICSAVILLRGLEGWGWFLIVGALCAGSSYEFCSDDKKKEEKPTDDTKV